MDASSTDLLLRSLFKWQLPMGSVGATVLRLCVHVTLCSNGMVTYSINACCHFFVIACVKCMKLCCDDV